MCQFLTCAPQFSFSQQPSLSCAIKRDSWKTKSCFYYYYFYYKKYFNFFFCHLCIHLEVGTLCICVCLCDEIQAKQAARRIQPPSAVNSSRSSRIARAGGDEKRKDVRNCTLQMPPSIVAAEKPARSLPQPCRALPGHRHILGTILHRGATASQNR